jgi:hypothetical protein
VVLSQRTAVVARAVVADLSQEGIVGHMDLFDQIETEYMEQHPGYAPPSMRQHDDVPQVPLYPLSMAQQQYPLAQVAPAPEPVLQRRVAGVPVWGWGLGVVGAAAGVAYYWYTKNGGKVEKNGGEESSSDEGSGLPRLPAGWKPSRSGFGDRLQVCLQKAGVADKTVVFIDADEAARKLKQVSPLVTIQCKGAKPPIRDLDKLAKREGLSAVEHDAGVVGFYPGGGKKGKAWEQYIDDLRDEGQKV